MSLRKPPVCQFGSSSDCNEEWGQWQIDMLIEAGDINERMKIVKEGE